MDTPGWRAVAPAPGKHAGTRVSCVLRGHGCANVFSVRSKESPFRNSGWRYHESRCPRYVHPAGDLGCSLRPLKRASNPEKAKTSNFQSRVSQRSELRTPRTRRQVVESARKRKVRTASRCPLESSPSPFPANRRDIGGENPLPRGC